jgi:hypothetical protein
LQNTLNRPAIEISDEEFHREIREIFGANCRVVDIDTDDPVGPSEWWTALREYECNAYVVEGG